MPVLTVSIPDDIFDELELQSRARLLGHVTRVAEATMSKVEWLRNHPDGKRFVAECMNQKYAGLSQKDLNDLTDKTYRLSLKIRDSVTKKLNEKQVRNDIVVEALRSYLMPVKSDNVVNINHFKTK